MEQVFTNIYKRNTWGENVSSEFTGSSGGGSELSVNTEYIAFLKDFIHKHKVNTVVDIGCGDWRCGEAIYGDLTTLYTGYDVYYDLVVSLQKNYTNPRYNFIHNDCSNIDTLKSADLLIVKDVLQHWSDDNVKAFLKNAPAKYKFILITNCRNLPNSYSPIQTGESRSLPFPEHPIWNGVNARIVLRYFTKEVVLINN
jgi:hypothetical protein